MLLEKTRDQQNELRQVEHGFWLKKYLRDVRDYQKRKSSAIERLESGYFLNRINRAC